MLSIQHPLRTHNLTLTPPQRCTRLPNSNRQRLKRTFRPVMIIKSPQAIHMQRHARGLRKALQTMRYHLATQVADLLSL